MSRAVGVLLLLAVAVWCGAPAAAQSPQSPQSPQTASEVQRLFDRVLRHANQQRSLNAAAPLTVDPRLATAAQAHAEDMAERDFVDHRSPTGQGLQDRLRIVSYPWRAIAENVAAGLSSPEGTVESWMTSPAHRDNLLNRDYVHVGIGYARPPAGKSSTYRHYWAIVFAAPSR